VGRSLSLAPLSMALGPRKNMKIARLYKYLSINHPGVWPYRRQLLVDRSLYFSDPTNFNDPLDCNIASAASLKGALHKCRVFCLSGEEHDDYLMFAHYADGHRGFRLTFEVDMDKTLDEIGVLGRGQLVKYVPHFPPDFDMSNVHQSLLMKLKCWEYEKEYRIFAVENNNLKYDKNALVEVAFGCRMDPDFEPVIRSWVSQGGHQRPIFRRVIMANKPDGFEYEDA